MLEQAGFTTHVVSTAGALQQALARSAWDALTALDISLKNGSAA